MVNGKGGGSGKYSYRYASDGPTTVQVSHMPDDGLNIRLAFRHNEDTTLPIIRINEREAECLWVALSAMAKDLEWDKSGVGPGGE